MRMYTELHFNTRLIRDCPPQIINTLDRMLGNDDTFDDLPNHPLFVAPCWETMLQSDSYYFDMLPNSCMEFDAITNQFFLSIRTYFTNYDNEISLFLQWIDPYLSKKKGSFLGFHRYEESNVPVLIFKK